VGCLCIVQGLVLAVLWKGWHWAGHSWLCANLGVPHCGPSTRLQPLPSRLPCLLCPLRLLCSFSVKRKGIPSGGLRSEQQGGKK
jgi:hypothetical protein